MRVAIGAGRQDVCISAATGILFSVSNISFCCVLFLVIRDGASDSTTVTSNTGFRRNAAAVPMIGCVHGNC